MEDVLDVYTRPYDEKRPQVCLDEVSAAPSGADATASECARPKRCSQDSLRCFHGTCNLFMQFEPLRGWRHVSMTDRRTRVDFAHIVKDLVDVHYPKLRSCAGDGRGQSV